MIGLSYVNLQKYAEAEKPYESCAILVGDESNENWTVNPKTCSEADDLVAWRWGKSGPFRRFPI